MKQASLVLALALSTAPSASAVAIANPQSLPQASAPAAAPAASPPEVVLPALSLDKTGATALTLEDSITLAIRAATSVLKAEYATAVTGAALLQGYGQFLPNLTTQAAVAYNSGRQYYTSATPTLVNGSNQSAGFSVNSDLNLFNGLADLSRLKSALARRDASDLTLYRAKQAIALDVMQSYLNVVLDARLVDIARKNLEQSQAREKLLREQTQVGARNLSDLFRQQAQSSLDESLLLTSENKLRSDQILLLQKLRVDVSKNYHFVDPQIPTDQDAELSGVRLDDEDKLLDTGLSNRVDLKAGDQTADAARWDAKGAWGAHLPQLDLVGSMTSGASYLYSQSLAGASVVPGSQNSIASQLGNQIEYSIGLHLTWSLFDRFVTRENVAQARAAADSADVDAQDLRNQVRADVRTAYGNYKTALQQLRASRKGATAAKKAYEVIDGRYEVGSANFIDLITVQTTLLQAETARAQAQIGFMLQEKSLDFATGELKVN